MRWSFPVEHDHELRYCAQCLQGVELAHGDTDRLRGVFLFEPCGHTAEFYRGRSR